MRLILLLNPALMYVAANVAVSALGFLRSIYLMRNLSHSDLGQVAMLQTIVVAVGFLQIGMINGGYRLYVSANPAKENRINDTVVTCFLGLAFVLLPLLMMLQDLGDWKVSNVEPKTFFLGCLIGFSTLLSNWFNNTLVAKGRLLVSSAVNFSAVVLSLSFVLIPERLDLEQAFLAFLIQPLVILVFILIINPPSRPKISVDGVLLKEMVVLGFSPFFAGVIVLINFQIERWFIVSYLGPGALGSYYLTIVYSTVFTLVPISLLNLFYPKIVSAYEQGNKELFFALMKKHRLILGIYISTAVLFTVLFLPFLLSVYLDSFSGFEHLVFILLPGLVVFTMYDNVALVLQSTKKMFGLFLFAFLALIFNLLTFAWSAEEGLLNLELSAVIKSVSYIAAAVITVAILIFKRKKLFYWS